MIDREMEVSCPLCGETRLSLEHDFIECSCGKIYCPVCGGSVEKNLFEKQITESVKQ